MKIYDLLLRTADWLEVASPSRDRALHVFVVPRIILIPSSPRRSSYDRSEPAWIKKITYENYDMNWKEQQHRNWKC